MSVLLQVSDPHFGTERPAVVEALVALMSDAAFYANEIPPGAQVRLSWDEGRLHRLQA